ncbi:MAG TPA: efflux RND transporter periplasmic adaptor subunit [Verrucomicrobiales bacterium]|nr:efflux RND transporter periplasmic adaptor subunit [Verrucomicrobiales bacterium]
MTSGQTQEKVSRSRALPACLLGVFFFCQGHVFAQDWHQGLCQANVDASLSFPVGGVLSKILVKKGDAVKEGDVILQLENETETLEVERQRLAVEAAKKEFERTKQIFEKGGSVSRADMDQKEAVWKIAIVEEQQAQALLKKRQLVASSGGTVVDLFGLDPGESVTANAPAARVVDTSQCRFITYVPGDSLHGFEKGREVELVFKTRKGEVTVSGSVSFVSEAIDAASGLQEVNALFDNKDGRVTAGLQGKMRLKPAAK